jgi:hypothetical protein
MRRLRTTTTDEEQPMGSSIPLRGRHALVARREDRLRALQRELADRAMR